MNLEYCSGMRTIKQDVTIYYAQGLYRQATRLPSVLATPISPLSPSMVAHNMTSLF